MGTFTVCRLRGIPIRITPSWLVALLLSTSVLGLDVFPKLLPNTAESSRWLLALVTSLAFFLSILLHELAHALVARSFGISVASITLFLLGGVAQITQEVKRPVAELLIAAAGPLTSIGLGGAFLVPALLLHRHQTPLVVVCMWLGFLNLSVGVFNLAPGFPMDGGRLLRATIWALGGSYHVATRIACWGGRAVAFCCIGLGLASVMRIPIAGMLDSGSFGGLWLVFIGLYLDHAARQSMMVQRILEHLGHYNAADLMLRDVPIVGPSAFISDFLPDLLAVRDCEAAFVAEPGGEPNEAGEGLGSRMIGMVMRGKAIVVPLRDHGRITARELMLPAENMQPASPDDDGALLLQRLDSEGLAAVPVVAGGEVLGLVGRSILVHHAMERRARR